jgi:hypothetical protein
MKLWNNPEIFDLSVENTAFERTGGRVDGGYIENPSDPNSNENANQPIPGHEGNYRS